MIARALATVVALLFAIAAFCGLGEGSAGPLNPFGLLFLLIAALIWDEWRIITGNFSPPILEGMWRSLVGASNHDDYFRAGDDHYRRDGPQHYRETENHDSRDRRRP
jgi:hypothetical protein